VTARRPPLSGAAAASSLAGTLDRVGALVSYLKADIGPVECTRPGPGARTVEDGMWLSCQDLVSDGAWLGQVIEGTGGAIGTDDPVVAASIFVQGYAYRLAMLAVACLTVDGVVPGAEPGAMAVGLGRGRVSKVAYLEPTVFDLLDGRPPTEALRQPSVADRALTVILDQVIELHLRPLIALTREQVRIGERLLWGNVAASASTAFRTMEGCQGRWVTPLGERFFTLAPSELQGLGSFLSIESKGKRGWYWERTNCCLFYQIDGHAKCSDCSLTPAHERRAAYEAGLSG
jgi:Ferric iron reductase FhuF-like transporter/FhuF 2Fe-2S C-terminal domain